MYIRPREQAYGQKFRAIVEVMFWLFFSLYFLFLNCLLGSIELVSMQTVAVFGLPCQELHSRLYGKTLPNEWGPAYRLPQRLLTLS